MSMAETFRNDIFHPRSAEEVRDVVAAAVASGEPLAVEGTGSKRGLGRPVQAARTLSLAALTGVTLYEPDELVLSARAGSGRPSAPCTPSAAH